MRMPKKCLLCGGPLACAVAEDGRGLLFNGHLITWQGLRDSWQASGGGYWKFPKWFRMCPCMTVEQEKNDWKFASNSETGRV